MAFVKRIYVDKRIGPKNVGNEQVVENLNQVIKALQNLDGKEFTEVVLHGEGKALTVGGGNEGRFIAFVAINGDEAFYNLINPNNSSNLQEVEVVTGGQVGTFPIRQVVPLSLILTEIKTFYEKGQTSKQLWEKQK